MMYPIAGPAEDSRRRIISALVTMLRSTVVEPSTAVARSRSEVATTSWGDSATGTQLTSPPPGAVQRAAGSSVTGSAADSAMHASASGVAAMQSGTEKLAAVTLPLVPVMRN